VPEIRTPAAATAAVASRILREGARLAYDRAVRRSGIPATVGDLDPAYLGAVLGRRVEAMDVIDGTEGTTDRVRVALQGDGVPATAFVKMAAASTAVRVFGNLVDLGGDEVRFYRDLRPGLDIEAPRVHGIDHDVRTRRFVLVLEDLGARGCTFPELVDALGVDQAEAGLEVLARLHGAHWRDPALDGPQGGPAGDLRWVRANSSDPLLPLLTAVVQRLARRLRSQHGDLVGPDGRAILARYPAVAAAIDDGPHTVLHGDPHPGNWYLDGSRPGLLDWQAIRRGNPLRDVAYFLVLGLDPADRRAREREVLDGYRDALARHGGPALGSAEAWTGYRRMVAYPYVAAAFTAGFGGLQRDDTALEGLRRAAVAVDDLDPLGALDLR
jgi:hypothetical protein